jgi:hypothetical protein
MSVAMVKADRLKRAKISQKDLRDPGMNLTQLLAPCTTLPQTRKHPRALNMNTWLRVAI